MPKQLIASIAASLGLATLAAGCNTPPPPPSAPAAAAPAAAAPASSPATVTAATTTSETQPGAEIGKPAPDFALPDLDGKTVKLQDFHGKVVVLEWFNPECPFVRASHTKGSLNGLAKRYTERPDHSVVWLAIDSSAPGKQGSLPEKIAEGKARYGMTSPILRDERGDVGHRYGATNTPHMFVIDAQGVGRKRTYVFRGGGWGHGAGMCQTGAVGRAEQGARYQEILRTYFSGAEVVRMYG